MRLPAGMVSYLRPELLTDGRLLRQAPRQQLAVGRVERGRIPVLLIECSQVLIIQAPLTARDRQPSQESAIRCAQRLIVKVDLLGRCTEQIFREERRSPRLFRDAVSPPVAFAVERLDRLILIRADEQVRRGIVEADAVNQRVLVLIVTQETCDLFAAYPRIPLHQRLQLWVKRRMDRDLVKRLPPGIHTLPVGRGLLVERRSELPLKERERALLEKDGDEKDD